MLRIFKKAVELIREGKVAMAENAGKSIWFKVYGSQEEPYNVSIRSEGKGTKITCECRYFCQHPDRVCSHMVACIVLLAEYCSFRCRKPKLIMRKCLNCRKDFEVMENMPWIFCSDKCMLDHPY